jgi:hypothetical protein
MLFHLTREDQRHFAVDGSRALIAGPHKSSGSRGGCMSLVSAPPMMYVVGYVSGDVSAPRVIARSCSHQVERSRAAKHRWHSVVQLVESHCGSNPSRRTTDSFSLLRHWEQAPRSPFRTLALRWRCEPLEPLISSRLPRPDLTRPSETASQPLTLTGHHPHCSGA